MAEIFLDDYENTRTELPVYGIPWEINNTISVTYNTNSIVAFQSEFYHFTGGAHGISGIYFANFDSKDGKKLTLSDLLIAGYKKELDNIPIIANVDFGHTMPIITFPIVDFNQL